MIEITLKSIIYFIIYLLFLSFLLKIDYTFLSPDLNRTINKTLIGLLGLSLFFGMGVLGVLMTVEPTQVYDDKTQIVSLDGVQVNGNTLYTESGTELNIDKVVLNENSSMYDTLYMNILMQRKFGPFVHNSKMHILELSKMNYAEYKAKAYTNIYLVSDETMRLNIIQDSSNSINQNPDMGIKGFNQ